MNIVSRRTGPLLSADAYYEISARVWAVYNVTHHLLCPNIKPYDFWKETVPTEQAPA